MKRYLNRQEKYDFYVLAAFLVYLEDLIKKWANRDKSLLKDARTCRTYTHKVATALVANLDGDEKTRLMADCKKHTVAAVRRSEYDQLKKRQSVLEIEEEDLKEITDYALLICQICQEPTEKVVSCELRRLLMKYQVPPFSESAPVGVCQYVIPDFENRIDVIRGLLKGA